VGLQSYISQAVPLFKTEIHLAKALALHRAWIASVRLA